MGGGGKGASREVGRAQGRSGGPRRLPGRRERAARQAEQARVERVAAPQRVAIAPGPAARHAPLPAVVHELVAAPAAAAAPAVPAGHAASHAAAAAREVLRDEEPRVRDLVILSEGARRLGRVGRRGGLPVEVILQQRLRQRAKPRRVGRRRRARRRPGAGRRRGGAGGGEGGGAGRWERAGAGGSWRAGARPSGGSPVMTSSTRITSAAGPAHMPELR